MQFMDIRSFDVVFKMKWIKFLIEKDWNILNNSNAKLLTNLKNPFNET